MAPCPSQAGIACVERAEGDVDGDGAVDAVVLFYELVDRPPAGRDAAAITVQCAYPTGETEEVTLDGSGHAARLVGVTDLDGDERDEVVYVIRVADTSVGGFAEHGRHEQRSPGRVRRADGAVRRLARAHRRVLVPRPRRRRRS